MVMPTGHAKAIADAQKRVAQLEAENAKLRREQRVRERPLTDDEREELFLHTCEEHARTGKPIGEDGDPFSWCDWYKEDVGRLIALVRKYKDDTRRTVKPRNSYNRDEDPNAKEPCCDCGEDYPRSELLAGDIFCKTCRVKDIHKKDK